MPARSSSPAELRERFRRIVEYAETAAEPRVEVPTKLALAVLRMAERASDKGRGRRPITAREQTRVDLILDAAIKRRDQLIAGGLKKGATKQAAEEANKKIGKARNLDVATVIRMMGAKAK